MIPSRAVKESASFVYTYLSTFPTEPLGEIQAKELSEEALQYQNEEMANYIEIGSIFLELPFELTHRQLQQIKIPSHIKTAHLKEKKAFLNSHLDIASLAAIKVEEFLITFFVKKNKFPGSSSSESEKNGRPYPYFYLSNQIVLYVNASTPLKIYARDSSQSFCIKNSSNTFQKYTFPFFSKMLSSLEAEKKVEEIFLRIQKDPSLTRPVPPPSLFLLQKFLTASPFKLSPFYQPPDLLELLHRNKPGKEVIEVYTLPFSKNLSISRKVLEQIFMPPAPEVEKGISCVEQTNLDLLILQRIDIHKDSISFYAIKNTHFSDNHRRFFWFLSPFIRVYNKTSVGVNITFLKDTTSAYLSSSDLYLYPLKEKDLSSLEEENCPIFTFQRNFPLNGKPLLPLPSYLPHRPSPSPSNHLKKAPSLITLSFPEEGISPTVDSLVNPNFVYTYLSLFPNPSLGGTAALTRETLQRNIFDPSEKYIPIHKKPFSDSFQLSRKDLEEITIDKHMLCEGNGLQETFLGSHLDLTSLAFIHIEENWIIFFSKKNAYISQEKALYPYLFLNHKIHIKNTSASLIELQFFHPNKIHNSCILTPNLEAALVFNQSYLTSESFNNNPSFSFLSIKRRSLSLSRAPTIKSDLQYLLEAFPPILLQRKNPWRQINFHEIMDKNILGKKEKILKLSFSGELKVFKSTIEAFSLLPHYPDLKKNFEQSLCPSHLDLLFLQEIEVYEKEVVFYAYSNKYVESNPAPRTRNCYFWYISPYIKVINRSSTSLQVDFVLGRQNTIITPVLSNRCFYISKESIPMLKNTHPLIFSITSLHTNSPSLLRTSTLPSSPFLPKPVNSSSSSLSPQMITFKLASLSSDIRELKAELTSLKTSFEELKETFQKTLAASNPPSKRKKNKESTLTTNSSFSMEEKNALETLENLDQEGPKKKRKKASQKKLKIQFSS